MVLAYNRAATLLLHEFGISIEEYVVTYWSQVASIVSIFENNNVEIIRVSEKVVLFARY